MRPRARNSMTQFRARPCLVGPAASARLPMMGAPEVKPAAVKGFRERLQDGVVVCDGAMGTMLYARGVFLNRCFDELNLSNPALVRAVHEEYVEAGADVLETNTFGAHRFKLGPHGFERQVQAINRDGALLARQAAQGR